MISSADTGRPSRPTIQGHRENSLSAPTHDDFSPGGDEQHLIGLLNRMRVFAPANVVSGAEAVLRAIVEVALKPSVEPRQLAKEALSSSPVPDLLLAFSEICRTDLDRVARSAPRRDRPFPAWRITCAWEIRGEFSDKTGVCERAFS
jgi:hypothetical protein